jgi:MarR-like DNA-binding transcriptional regulator SgrR of sgrS sRNA
MIRSYPQPSIPREEEPMSAQLYIKKPVQSANHAALGLERHYSVGEIAERWGLSEKTIRRMFENEEGVLQWGSPETRRKRGYITLRIPESVMLRVHRNRTQRAS